MFAVIFEVRPRPERWDDYLGIARMLRPELESVDGFVENTRYRSDARAGVLLSLSLWRDEKALIRWRTHAGHFASQVRGRREILADYRLRVGEMAAMIEHGAAVALPAQRFDETAVGDAKAIAFLRETPPPIAGALDEERFTAILEPHDTITMACFASMDDAGPVMSEDADRRFIVRIIRDYGLMDRREAPQFHAPVGI